jgi:hypothetical protein
MAEQLAAVSGDTKTNTAPNKQIYEIVVDPDRAHLGESFVIDMRKLSGNYAPKDSAVDASSQRNNIAENLMRMAAVDRASENTSVKQANSQTSSVTQDAHKVGRVISNIQGIDHAHPANPLPTSNLAPPNVKVTFDMSGIGSIAFRYHKVINTKTQIIFVTDKRHSGGAEFYPYCNMRANEAKKPIGVYVEGENRVFLLDPSVPGFPIRFDCDPYEFCVIPVAGAKNLNSAMIKELGIVNSNRTNDTTEGATSDGEASSDTGGLNSTESYGERGSEESVSDYESVEGGRGGVL